jgi:hypothetical protein
MRRAEHRPFRGLHEKRDRWRQQHVGERNLLAGKIALRSKQAGQLKTVFAFGIAASTAAPS